MGPPLRRMPAWALPFPNGQLSAFDRMGRLADSIERWRAIFGAHRRPTQTLPLPPSRPPSPPLPRLPGMLPGSECFVFVSLDEIVHTPGAVPYTIFIQ